MIIIKKEDGSNDYQIITKEQGTKLLSELVATTTSVINDLSRENKIDFDIILDGFIDCIKECKQNLIKELMEE